MTTETNGPPAPRESLRLDLEDIRCWLLEQIDGGEEVKGHDSMLSTYINTIDNALAALSSEKGVMGLEPRGCPTPGSCSAVEELADLKQRLLPQANGRAERAEKARQMAVAERDEMLEKLIVRQTTVANLHDVIDGMRGAARVEEGAIEPTEEMVTKGVEAMIAYIFNGAPGEMLAMDGRREAMRHAYIAMIKAQRRDMKGGPDRPDWAQQLPGAELYDRDHGYNRTASLNEGRYVCTCGACMSAPIRDWNNK
jgi:hypothetical protein